MRILHIASGDFFSTYGGGQVYVKNVVDTMIGMGTDIAIVSLTGNHNEIKYKDYHGASMIEISSAAMLEEAVNKAKPDIIHAHSIKDIACKIGHRLHIPVIITSHHGGILCPAGTRLNCKDEICHCQINHRSCLPCVLRNTRTALRCWYPFMRYLPESAYCRLGDFLHKLPFIPFITPIGTAAGSIKSKLREWNDIISYCSVMVAPCREIADAMIHNKLSADKVRVLPHGIPLPDIRPEYPDVINGKIRFYYVGRICYFKGVHTLLEAFFSVKNPQIELHLIGGAGNRQEQRYMEKLKKRFSTDKRITWHGKIAPEDIFKTTCSYHVSISATFLEAFGLNIAEAHALGKPVISTRSGGGEMQITDGVNGWLVPINSPDALAEKISYISAHPEILPEISANCRAISIREHCSALLRIYDEIV